MGKQIPIRPAHPERVCWGCERYCAADALACGNGSERCPHPCELFGDDWMHWQPEAPKDHSTTAASISAPDPGESDCARSASPDTSPGLPG